MNADNRKFTRIEFVTKGEIKYKSNIIKGTVKNLSLKGGFFQTSKKIEIGKIIKFTIHLIGGTSNLSFTVKSKVIRQDKNGIALQFINFNLDSFIHLKNIIQYNTTDPLKIMKEFKNFIDENISAKTAVNEINE